MEAIRQGKIGGGETHVLDLVQYLNKEHFEPVVLSFTPGPMVDHLNSIGIKTHVIETETPFDIRVWKKVQRLLIEERIDLLHAHGTRAASNTFWAGRKLNIRSIYTVHGWSFHPDQSKPMQLIRKQSEKLLANKFDRVINVSESNYREGKNLLDIKNCEIILNSINSNKFNPDKHFKDIRKELGIEKDVFLLGFVGRMTEQKAPLLLIKAFSNVYKSLNIHLLMVGDGNLQNEAIALSKELGIEKKITFAGFRQDVPDILQSLDVYCLPSLWEGLPIGLLEAMAMRKAVIVSDIPGNNDLVRSEENGILFPTLNQTKLEEGILKLYHEPELRKKIAHNAFELIQNNFHHEKMVNKISQLYYSLLFDKK